MINFYQAIDTWWNGAEKKSALLWADVFSEEKRNKIDGYKLNPGINANYSL